MSGSVSGSERISSIYFKDSNNNNDNNNNSNNIITIIA